MAVNIFMPDLSASSGTVTLARWLRAEGDAISAGDILAEMEADKATIEIEAPADGILGRILVPDGTQGVCADQVVGIVVGSDEKLPDISGMNAGTVPHPAQKAVAEVSLPVREEKVSIPAVPDGETRTRIFASPVARRLARLHDVDLKQVDGSGPQGRILRRDIDRLVPDKTIARETEKPEDKGDHVAMSGMRRVIAERLTKAKQTIPHFYVSVDVQVDALLTLRDELNRVAPAPDAPDTFRLSVNDMLIRAASVAFVAVPSMNVMYSEEALLFPRQVDIAVAVSVPDGLLVPVVRDAGRKSLATTSREVRSLIERARAGKLRVDEMQGGCFTISNVGMFGVDTLTPIINPPHAAILGIGAISRRPVVREEQFAIASLMTCTLCVDHRVVDGALAAQWLGTFRTIVEQPIRLLT
ncbi:pyruvate dehydrogenase complex dihydrolipoamide acetyltransferase [Komagataeibacter sp. FXV2]|nr:pyruvate dehydrogenase complex dihydrolipoamide acetyltransferase [Komagataeibacter sp. FXV2]